MEKYVKSFPAFIIKADNELGIVEAIVAVTGDIDLGDDLIHYGAFTKTITERLGKIRVLDNHNSTSVMNVVGKPIEIREVTKSELPQELLTKYPNASGGLYTKTQYLIDTPEGLGTFKRIKVGAIDEYSIGFSIPKGKFDYSDVKLPDNTTKRVRNIREVMLFEYSPVIWAMQPATTTLDAKHMITKEMSLTHYVSKVRESFEELYEKIIIENGYEYSVYSYYVIEVFANYIYICGAYDVETEYPYYKVNYSYDANSDKFTFASSEQWIGGSYQFTEGVKSVNNEQETKSGKVLSSANYNKLKEALDAINEIMMNAGMMEDMPEDETMPEMPEMMSNNVDNQEYTSEINDKNIPEPIIVSNNDNSFSITDVKRLQEIINLELFNLEVI